MKNCGTKVHVLVGDELFMTTLSKITRVWLRGFSSKSKMVAHYGLDTIQAWGEAFESRKYLYPHIYGTYTKLRAKSYIKFPGIQYDQRRVPIFLGPISHNEKQFVADYRLEIQQMEDIDLLYFGESDDECEETSQTNEGSQSVRYEEQLDLDPFFGQRMDMETYFSQPPSSLFPFNDSSAYSNSRGPSTLNSPGLLWSLQETNQSMDDKGRIVPLAAKTQEQRESIGWDQFESSRPLSIDAAVQTDDDDDKFHFFDDVVKSAQVPEPSNQREEIPSNHTQLFMTLDPFHDPAFMIKHEQFSRSHKELVNELNQRRKSSNFPDQGRNPSDAINPKDENDPWHSNSDRTERESRNVPSGIDPFNLVSEMNQIPKNSQTKKSASYDPSSDPKNRVVFFGTQRIIRREG